MQSEGQIRMCVQVCTWVRLSVCDPPPPKKRSLTLGVKTQHVRSDPRGMASSRQKQKPGSLTHKSLLQTCSNRTQLHVGALCSQFSLNPFSVLYE